MQTSMMLMKEIRAPSPRRQMVRARGQTFELMEQRTNS